MDKGIMMGADAMSEGLKQVNQEMLNQQKEYLDEKEKMTLDAERQLANELAKVQAESARDYANGLRMQADKIKTALRTQKTAIINDFDEIAKRATSSLSEIEKATQKMEEKMISFGGLFEKRKEVFTNTGPGGTAEVFEKTILDLSQERAELEKYAYLLQKVKGMGDIPQELFSAIRDLSIPDAIRYQEALLSMTEGERSAYLADWNAIQALASETARSSYAEETKEVLAAVEAELENWYGTIPAGFLRQGALSAEQFGAGFVSKLADLQNELQNVVVSLLTSPIETTPAGSVGTSHVQNTHNNTYVLKESGETVAQQLQVIASAELVKRMRGLD